MAKASLSKKKLQQKSSKKMKFFFFNLTESSLIFCLRNRLNSKKILKEFVGKLWEHFKVERQRKIKLLRKAQKERQSNKEYKKELKR